MKKRIAAFAAGMLTMALLGSLGIGALAANGYSITVEPVNIQVNGQTFQPKDVNGNSVPVFTYNGTTYAPLRALAEAYGLEVGYDAEANMATVGETEAAPVTDGQTNGGLRVVDNNGKAVEKYLFNEKHVYLDGVEITSDAPMSVTVLGSTYFNLNAVAKACGVSPTFNKDLAEDRYLLVDGSYYVDAPYLVAISNASDWNYDMKQQSLFLTSAT